MKLKKHLVWILAAALFVGSLLSSCNAKPNGGNTDDSDTIKVGFYGTLAGSGAYVDTAAKMAIEDYVEEINTNGGW